MKKRNYGIDILRIISMYMVMVLHILLRGGILLERPFTTMHSQVTGLMEFVCIGAVNIFALISGYVGVKSKYKYGRIIDLWLHVVCFSYLCLAIFKLMGTPISTQELLSELFPTIFEQYWYFNSYLVLFLLEPMISAGLKSLSQRQYKLLIVATFLLTSFLLFVFHWKAFDLNQGYSALWLIVMYIYGAYFKLYGIPAFFVKMKSKLLAGFFVLSFLNLLGTDLLTFIFSSFNQNAVFKVTLLSYNWPLTVIGSILLFLYFVQLDIKNIRIINIVEKISPFAFGAYLLQTNVLMFKLLNYSSFAYKNVFLMIGLILLVAAVWFMLGVLIDKAIQHVLTRFRIVEGLLWLGRKVMRVVS